MARTARCGVWACCVAALFSSGCAILGSSDRPSAWAYPHAYTETYAETPDDHYIRVSRILAADRRGLAEDLDLLFMTERQGRLTRWHD